MTVTQEQLDLYDEVVDKYLRGEATFGDVWAADPYDDELRRIAQRCFERDGVKEERGVTWQSSSRT